MLAGRVSSRPAARQDSGASSYQESPAQKVSVENFLSVAAVLVGVIVCGAVDGVRAVESEFHRPAMKHDDVARPRTV